MKVQFQFGAEPDNKKVKRLAAPLHSIVIMAFALIDFDLSIDHTINKSVRIVNASAPIA